MVRESRSSDPISTAQYEYNRLAYSFILASQDFTLVEKKNFVGLYLAILSSSSIRFCRILTDARALKSSQSSATLDIISFKQFLFEHPTMLDPVYDAQHLIQVQSFGEKYWAHERLRRSGLPRDCLNLIHVQFFGPPKKARWSDTRAKRYCSSLFAYQLLIVYRMHRILSYCALAITVQRRVWVVGCPMKLP